MSRAEHRHKFSKDRGRIEWAAPAPLPAQEARRLSTDLIESVSQILQQKADWQVKAETNAGGNFDRDGALIRQRTSDPKCILVIGGDGAFSGSDAEREAKLRTFELFRRDSRNMDILTYGELYERAAFVVGRSARQEEG